jgi:dTDP-4-dehydrorhamnose 3,5-epimerase
VIIHPTPLVGLSLVDTPPIVDQRGAFTRYFCDRELAEVLGTRGILQINHSRTREVGAVRGLHYQYPPHAEMKFVRCLRGRVWDVVVDLRRDSPSFLHWHAEELSPERATMLVIPEGCAHGFQVLERDSELLYLHTAHYEKVAEGGLRHDEPRLAIPWPLPVSDLSERDKSHPLIDKDFPGIDV